MIVFRAPDGSNNRSRETIIMRIRAIIIPSPDRDPRERDGSRTGRRTERDRERGEGVARSGRRNADGGEITIRGG